MLAQIQTILTQILIMFLLMAVGYIIYRLHLLDDHTTRQIASVLAKVVAPAILISSFQRAYDPALGGTLFRMLLCAFITFLIGILFANLVYRPQRYPNYGSRRMCAVFSNDGFMALPLLEAMFGQTGIFLGSAHIVAAAILSWTYGVHQLRNGKPSDRHIGLRVILLNPGTIALAAGTLLFLSPWKLPDPVYQAMRYVGSLNTPLAMLLLGCYLAQTDLLRALRDRSILSISLVRLVVIPCLTLPFLLLSPLNEAARTILLIGFSTPVAVVAATFSQMFGSDYLYSTRAVAVSTLLSAVTMPCMLALYTLLRSLLP